MALRYERPATVEHAAALLAAADGRARVLAGGTDLLVSIRSGESSPTLIVDIKGIPGMNEIRWTPGGDLRIGAAVEVRRIYEETRILHTYAALAEGAGSIGSLQIRNRATMGGNLANASPCMDTAPPLLVLGARLQVVGSAGEREIPLDAFFVGVKKTVLEPDEILASILVPCAPVGLRSAFEKIKRIHGHDLALVNAAGSFDPGARTIRVAIGSCAETPILLPALTEIDPGAAGSEEIGERLGALAAKHLCPIDDVRASAEYRRDMAALLCHRLARRLLGRPDGRP